MRWRLAGNLAPCSCAATVEYIVHSCCVLVAKPDLASHCNHRLQSNLVFPCAQRSDLSRRSATKTEGASFSATRRAGALPKLSKAQFFCFRFFQPMETPEGMSPSMVTSLSVSPFLAASSIPCDSMPRILAGLRLATMTMVLPTISSGV